MKVFNINYILTMARIPTLKTQPKKPKLNQSEKRKIRQKIYHTTEWDKLRLAHLQSEPLCRVCSLLGIVKAGECVHHIHTFIGTNTKEQMYDIAFDGDNLVTLCTYHHSLLHSLDQFKNKEYKTAEELAEYIKDHPEIGIQKPKLTEDQLIEMRSLCGKQLAEWSKENLTKKVYKFNTNGDLLAEYESYTEAHKDGFNGRYDKVINNEFIWSLDKDFKVTDKLYKVFAFDKQFNLLGKFFTIKEASEYFNINQETISKGIENKRITKGIIFTYKNTFDINLFKLKKDAKGNNKKKVGQFNLSDKLVKVFDCAKDAATANKVTNAVMTKMCRGEKKKLINGYRFRFL